MNMYENVNMLHKTNILLGTKYKKNDNVKKPDFYFIVLKNNSLLHYSKSFIDP